MRTKNKENKGWKVIYTVQVVKDVTNIIKSETFEDKKEALSVMYEWALEVQKTGNFDTVKAFKGMYGYHIMNEGSVCHYVTNLVAKIVKA